MELDYEESNPFTSIPEDITTKILSKLPVISILQCKCVYKSWRSLISSPQFAKAHLNYSSHSNNLENYFLIVGTHAYPRRFFTCSFSSIIAGIPRVRPISFRDEKPISKLVGTCNGLVCGSTEEQSIILSNPTTRKFKKLTVPKFDMVPVTYGFCYDKLNDDYKVVMLISPWINGSFGFETKAKVYSLRDDSWKEIEYFKGGRASTNADGICVSGTLHWSALSNWDDPPFILSLDITKYVYGIVELPNCSDITEKRGEWTLADFSGFLGLICDYDEVRVDIWMMEEYGVKESWKKLRSIPYPLNFEDVIAPVLMSANGEVVPNYYPHLLEYNSGNDLLNNFELDGSTLYFHGTPTIQSIVPLTYCI